MNLEPLDSDLYRFAFSGIGSNAYVLVGSQVLLIDSGVQSQSLDFKRALEAQGFRADEVSHVLHSHGHADHFGTSFLFSKALCWMSVHDAGHVNARDESFSFARELGTTKFPVISEHLAYDSNLSLGGFSFRVLHTPGHTLGSVCLWEASRGWLFSGDTLFRGSCGRVDLPSGSATDMRRSLESLQRVSFDRLFPGHGPPVEKHQRANIDVALHVLGV